MAAHALSAAQFAVSLHDVAPATWTQCERLLTLCDAVGVKVTLLVVPRYHHTTAIDEDESFQTQLRARVSRGDEVVLHGYHHLDDSAPARTAWSWLRRHFYTASEGEFDSISESVAQTRLADGLGRLAAIGCPAQGFIAPAWLLGTHARRALLATGLPYTCSQEWLERLRDGRRLHAPSLVCSTRAGWRRWLSRRVVQWRLISLAKTPLVRVALHPADARYDSIVTLWQQTLQQLAAHRAPALESQWILHP